MKKIILSGNTDYGEQIGSRIKIIVENLDNPLVLCRGGSSRIVKVIHPLPLGTKIMKFFTGVQVYISPKLPTNKIKNYLFDSAIKETLKNIDLTNYKVFHSWDFTPKTYEFLRTKYPKIKIIQDVPIALNSILKTLKSDSYYSVSSTAIESYILNSLKYVDKFIVPSDFVKESLLLLNIPAKKIKIVQFGVDSKKFIPGNVKTLSPCFIGNVNYRKGISYLITAWNELNLEIKLHIYGRKYPEINNYSGKNVIFHGVKNNNVLKNHNLYLFPSLFEGSSKSVYEAMASGMAVITTKNSGSIVQNGKEGFIIPAQDIKSLKEKILYYYKNPKVLAKHGSAARKKATKYTWEKYAKEVIKIYK